jgi:protocatechuate 3,4-dioxygenase beta subunit
MSISGVVYEPDGSPAQGVVLFLYHTDASGLYSRPNDPLNPRLHGWVRTDRRGRYEFETVRPGPYPGTRVPAHTHVHAFGPNRPEWFIEEFRFSDDPFLSDEERSLPKEKGAASSVVLLVAGPDGVWHGTRDIHLDPPRR